MIDDATLSPRTTDAGPTFGAVPRPSNALRRACLMGVVAVALAGGIAAVANLPVVTGCGFYGQCGSDVAGGADDSADQ